MAVERWILTYEEVPGRGGRVTAGRGVPLDRPVQIGREGEVPVGVGDPAVSRLAATVTATATGWQIEVTNRNGVMLHPWGQPAELAPGATTVQWPLVALRLLPGSARVRHWILLEADDLPVTPAGPMPARAQSTWTKRAPHPRDLTPGELEALNTVFCDVLSWPPRLVAGPLLLKQAATQLQKSARGVQFHLANARQKAVKLGLPPGGEVTDPDFLFLLVQAGFLAPPAGRSHRPPAS